eukprot:12838097-Ditylum_brightwellii.AAC.2
MELVHLYVDLLSCIQKLGWGQDGWISIVVSGRETYQSNSPGEPLRGLICKQHQLGIWTEGG